MKTGSEQIEADFIIIGSGVAGLRAAMDLVDEGRVLILTKTELTESNSRYAQGGIAAAIGESDSVGLHQSDTLAAGAGLCDDAAVGILAAEASPEIERLIAWGTDFDRAEQGVALGREGAHSRARVLHAQGDATGREIVRALSARVRELGIPVVPFAFAAQILRADGRAAGVRFIHDGRTHDALAPATLVASGGGGQVYRETTNPPVATGDGFVLGYDAGALLRDMEFVQFHPTALRLPGLPPFLISEAVRGEGAWLIDDAGNRFVDELAPRDLVARAIYERTAGGAGVYLDLRNLRPGIRTRFPQIDAFCTAHGIDIARDPIPVTPAAHYFMGGLYTDLDGRTSLPGLYAAGEAASCGVHGANRLASNSLLECVVFGRRAAAAMLEQRNPAPARTPEIPAPVRAPHTAAADREFIRQTAWQCAGILRNARGLQSGMDLLDAMERNWTPQTNPSIEQMETRNLWTVARLILASALARQESRGAHYRTDYPHTNDAVFRSHSWVRVNTPAFVGPAPTG